MYLGSRHRGSVESRKSLHEGKSTQGVVGASIFPLCFEWLGLRKLSDAFWSENIENNYQSSTAA